MNKLFYCAAVLTLGFASFAQAADQQQPQQPPQQDHHHHHHHHHRPVAMRMDCRFYSEHHSCVASATYESCDGREIRDIHYGVSCDRQTIYDDQGTYMPQQTVSDGIRPITSAIPRVELMPQSSLRHPGTYTSKLETEEGKFMNGVCYVNRDEDWTSDHDHGNDQQGDDQGSDQQNDGQQHGGQQDGFSVN